MCVSLYLFNVNIKPGIAKINTDILATWSIMVLAMKLNFLDYFYDDVIYNCVQI